jgi:hypothetical protein
MISAQGFRTLTKKYEYEIFADYIKDIIKPQVYQVTRVSNNEIEFNRISLENIKYNHNKKIKPNINPTIILFLEYLNFTDIFSKIDADILPEYSPNDFSFTLRNRAEYKNSRGYPLILLEDKRIRDYITTYFSKNFIIISSIPYIVPILFIKKPGGRIRFCIDYRKLNAITKKNTHPIPLIKKTLVAFNKTVIMSKLDIRYIFNRIRFKTTINEDLIIFKTSINIFKYLVVLFRLANRPAVF